MSGHLRLGVNIDHVATVRNARGGDYPDPLRAAKIAEEAGADGITAHLREDRRHISDKDIDGLMEVLSVPLNFEMAATDEMQKIALRHKPHAVCIVPEKREEKTTEGGLEVAREENKLAHFIAPLREAGCRVSIFIAADRRQIEAANRIGAEVIELHTGAYCDAHAEGRVEERNAELHRAFPDRRGDLSRPEARHRRDARADGRRAELERGLHAETLPNPAVGVPKAQAFGMEHQARIVPRGAFGIERIAEDRVADGKAMDAELM